MTDSPDQNKQLAGQITELRAQVARLQAVVEQTGAGKSMSPRSGKMSPAQNKSMGMMGDKGEMSGMSPGKNAPMASGMSMGDDQDGMSGGAPATAAAMGMCCMGGMGAMGSGGSTAMSGKAPTAPGMAQMSGTASATPGQAGASHLYHIGSDGFFLNHSRHISLSPDQRFALNHAKEQAMLDRATVQRRIDQAEQELYGLTGVDQPDNAKMQAKVTEIEKMRADQRMNFIRSVGDATNVLTHDQHRALLGVMVAPGK